MSAESRAMLERSRPSPDQYENEEDYLAAKARWLTTVGKILALTSRSPASPPPSKSPATDE
jgi:hypothetical protein